MKFDAEKFCLDFGIEYTKEGKHSGIGWVNLPCPFCSGNPGNHLGLNEDGYANCFRCGWKDLTKTIAELTGCSYKESQEIRRAYKLRVREPEKQETSIPDIIEWPIGTIPLMENKTAVDYLENKRNFNALTLQEIWGLKATGHLGPYKFRILAPIYRNNQVVSYQGRDYTDRQIPKYKACPQKLEIYPHKKTLYGEHLARDNQSVIICEGIMDVWRIGPGAVATYGIDFIPAQVKRIMELWKRVIVLFDSEPQAQKQAEKLANSLFRVEVNILNLAEGDPADLSQEDANELRNEFL